RMFKSLAMELEIPIILIAQPRKLTNVNKPMNYWDLKDSAAIPADADTLCILHRDRTTHKEGNAPGDLTNTVKQAFKTESFKSETLFIVDAGRYTAGGSVNLIMEGNKHLFKEIKE
ncbi:MAG: hypothetical protein EHM87_25320, partial [Burkholderiales bacterium]